MNDTSASVVEHNRPVGSWQRRYLDRFYDRRKGWVDGTQNFFNVVERYVTRGTPILEIGCGPTNTVTKRLAAFGPVHGFDVDPDARTNVDTVEVRISDGRTLPFDDASFDVAVSNYVLEHVEDPGAHLREVARVLKPGGVYLARTPNKHHYVALVSALTPHAFHVLMAHRLRRNPAEAHDPYPTFYRMNSAADLNHLVGASRDLTIEEMEHVEKEPSYGMIHPVVFLILMAYERLVNRFKALERFRANLIVAFRKKAVAGG